ncbi:uncharacterized protein EDB93DRAFT_1120883 [Suillus bovinus]|uniref:uncharacterized protein n=1 Tax=Suillus bovinus TaxID=48563 RepID=UPI001B866161|nr:uncharacterized protein EDB93DRAFT_1120883 [Suillus bovinus]KAG2158327.1 hypothetical protein EDB93DRAFT_1120883 [Suillus bovinus]
MSQKVTVSTWLVLPSQAHAAQPVCQINLQVLPIEAPSTLESPFNKHVCLSLHALPNSGPALETVIAATIFAVIYDRLKLMKDSAITNLSVTCSWSMVNFPCFVSNKGVFELF